MKTGWLRMVFGCTIAFGCFSLAAGRGAADRKTEYVDAVTRGEGLLPGQERGPSPEELAFRETIESYKDEMLRPRGDVRHPVLLTDEDFEQARHNIESADWARDWYRHHETIADFVIGQPEDYIERMIPELTPTNTYGGTCPNCVGTKSQEGVGRGIFGWDYENPEVMACRRCGHVYPSAEYPETATLVCPRAGQTFTYYLNDEERAHPDDRSGRYAWHWVGHPIHVSFTGVIRWHKAQFMASSAKSLGVVYRMTGDARYARKAAAILEGFARCYRNWLYHDYWDTMADCDPMYAAWHDKQLRLEWKRHLCTSAYNNDSADRAAMLQSYWGAGRVHPSTDAIGVLVSLCAAYDLTRDARDGDGEPLWTDQMRTLVERDLLLEYVIGAEPFVGGHHQAANTSNKAPRVYHAQATVARCLGPPRLAETALRGYEAVRDKSFSYDGYSHESPAYNNMFLSELALVPEQLHGFEWPADFGARQGVLDVYGSDDRLRLMFRAMIDQLRPDGLLPPLSDTSVTARPSPHLLELGQMRYPEYYDGALPALYHGRAPTEYAVFHLSPEEVSRDRGLELPEIFFPAWMTAILRHGSGPGASMLSLALNPPGGHRHNDNLSLFYVDRGRTVLGDHGYVGDMPVNRWIRHTFSHNLVVVDDGAQRFGERRPRLHRMVTSDEVSVVEASSNAYDQCSDYRRLVCLIKGPDGRTFAVDIFRVKGGRRHDYRLFSELASSDAPEGRLEFEGLTMPEERPLPQVGASLADEDIFGLRDVRTADDPPAAWTATWREPGGWYRLWMLSPADRVAASNGPGQETREQLGRRVRYVDVVREGDDLQSTFVAVHEPGGAEGVPAVIRAERLPVAREAGADAVAVRIESNWGSYLVLSDFAEAAEVGGVRFRGRLGVLHTSPEGSRWLLTSEATTCRAGDLGFENAEASWAGKIAAPARDGWTTDSSRPADYPTLPEDVTAYVIVGDGESATGLPIESVADTSIRVGRFPLEGAGSFRVPIVRFLGDR